MIYNAIVVGGSIAGCTLGLSLARRGARVLIDRKPDDAHYKTLCTHFIQPVAVPVIRKLALERELDRAGAVRTRAAFWSEAGWIDPPDDYGTGDGQLPAYNLERRILDPLLTRLAGAEPGVDLALVHDVRSIEITDGICRVGTASSRGSTTYFGKLVVAADGRNSSVARLLGNVAVPAENDRGSYFAYWEGVEAPSKNRSLFMLGDSEMAFLYPLGAGRVLLSAYIAKSEAGRWAATEDKHGLLAHFFSRFPDLPSLSRGRAASRVYGYRHYPNLAREAVFGGVAFVGDAALSLDPMSGVGCGFAMVSADMLADAVLPALLCGKGLDAALQEYARCFNSFFPAHAHGIKADSIIAKSPETIRSVYRRIATDPALQRDFIDLTGRLLSPAKFQRSFLLAGRQPMRAVS